MELQRQVVVAHIQRNGMCAGKPARQRAHVRSAESQPERVWANQPCLGPSLHGPNFFRRVGCKADDCARRLLLLSARTERIGARMWRRRIPASKDVKPLDLVALRLRQAQLEQQSILVDAGNGQNPFWRMAFEERLNRQAAQAEVAIVQRIG
eukprot:7388688-Prymnesium_polylepis.1